MSLHITATRITDGKEGFSYGFECEEALKADGWIKANCANTQGVSILLARHKELETANGNR